MALMFCLLLFRVEIPQIEVLEDHFDVIEVNHHYNEWGQEVWSQLILWDRRGANGELIVQHFIMMSDAYKKTTKGEKEHKKWQDKTAKTVPLTRLNQFHSETNYRGDFVGGRYFPVKSWREGCHVVKYIDESRRRRTIKGTIFRESHTLFDPERDNRKNYPEQSRRGLRNEDQDKTLLLFMPGIQKDLLKLIQ